MNIANEFARYSALLLSSEYVPRIQICIERLTDEQIWWRPNETSNSIGNLMLHLRGNVTQWIVHGIGDVPFQRDRDGEFSERKVIPHEHLLALLKDAVQAAEDVILNLNPAKYGETKMIQGNSTSVFEAIYHVVEHFSMHTGQILLMTKMITAKDLELDDFPGGDGKRPR